MSFARIDGDHSRLREPLPADRIEAACRAALGSATRLEATEELLAGRFNTSYALRLADGTRAVLRVAPPASAPLFRHERGLLARECALNPRLVAACPRVPPILHAEPGGAVLERPWVLLQHREGLLWDEVAPALRPGEADPLWRDFGEDVARIHAVSGEGWGCALSPGASFADWLLARVADLDADLAERGIAVAGLSAFRAWLDANRVALEPPGPPTLVHGDLWLRNVLVRRDGARWRLAAILDAERGFWGEPAAEWIFGFLPLPPAFWRGYGRDLSPATLDAATRLRAIVYRARGALQLLLECWRSRAPDARPRALFGEMLAALGLQPGPGSAAPCPPPGEYQIGEVQARSCSTGE